MKYITEALERQSAELIELAAALDMPLPPAVLRGTREAIHQPLRHRDSSMVELGRAIDEAKKTEARTASRIAALQAVADSMAALPMTIETDRFEGPYLKGEDFTLQLRSANGQAHNKLVVQIFTETRAARAASIRRLTEKENQLNRFRELTKPYRKHEVYETNANFRIVDNAQETVTLQISQLSEGYLVQRIIIRKRIADEKELAAILAAEVEVVHG